MLPAENLLTLRSESLTLRGGLHPGECGVLLAGCLEVGSPGLQGLQAQHNARGPGSPATPGFPAVGSGTLLCVFS